MSIKVNAPTALNIAAQKLQASKNFLLKAHVPLVPLGEEATTSAAKEAGLADDWGIAVADNAPLVSSDQILLAQVETGVVTDGGGAASLGNTQTAAVAGEVGTTTGAATAGAEVSGAAALSAAGSTAGAAAISTPALLGGGLGLAALAGGGAGGAGGAGDAPAVVAPTPAVAISGATDNVGNIQGNLVSGAFTDDTSLVLTGTVQGSTTVDVYDGNTKLGAAVVSGGTWTYAVTVANGSTYQFNAHIGTGANALVSSNFAITGDTVAPTSTAAIVTVTDNYGANVGPLTTGATTDDTSLGLAGTFTGTLGAGEVVAVYDGATRLGVAAVSGNNWTYTDSTLAVGDSIAYTVRVEDAAGNQAAASAPAFVAHISAPTATALITTIADNVAPIVGNLVSGGATNDTSLALSGTIIGTLVTGDTVVVYDGATNLGNATVSGSTWTYADASLADGDAVSYSVSVRNAAGEQSRASAAFITTIDTTAPLAPTLGATDDVGSIIGPLSSGAQTDDTVLLLSGSTEAGSTVAVFNGSTLLGAATVTGTNWSYTAPVANANTYQFNAVSTDVAGNVGVASSNLAVTVDTVAPTATAAIAAIADNVGSIVGNWLLRV